MSFIAGRWVIVSTRGLATGDVSHWVGAPGGGRAEHTTLQRLMDQRVCVKEAVVKHASILAFMF